jgi:citrate lyase subunit beta/citryl-CoA lyase
MPGANERALEKAKGLDADALILDLEDAVAPDAKAEARARVCALVSDGAYGTREVAIRANGLDTDWHRDDIAAIAAAGPAAVVVPKVNSVEDVRAIEAGLEAGGAPERTKIWAMVETPVAMLHAEAIAAASERLTVLVMGTNDLAKELHAEHVAGRQPLLTGLGLCVLAARATGKVILDGVYNDIKDPEGFEAECLQGRQMGFDGKTLIHPNQIAPANDTWAPSAEAVEDARALIATFEEAMAEGRGVVTHNGRMIENLHVETARRVLAIEAAIAAQG